MHTLNIQNNRLAYSIIVLAVVVCPLAFAETSEPGVDGGPKNLGPRASARQWLADSGIQWHAALTVDASKNISGGAGHAGTLRHLFDFNLEFDLDPILGIQGGTFFMDFQTQEGQDGSEETGDLQAYSNIDAEDFTALYEVWYQQELLDGLMRVKAGKIDANADFAYVEHGGEFIHSSPGFSPTLFVLPTYPDPAFGALVFFGEGEGFYAGAGLFDGALQEGVSTGTRGPATLFGSPADLFMIGEAGWVWGGGGAVLPGRVGLGLWHHTGRFARFDGGVESHTTGGFLVLDQLVYKENDADDDDQGVGVFGQFGWADDDVAEIAYHAGAGAQWAGAIPQRDADVFGLMLSWAGLTDAPGAGFREDAELAVELFYKMQVGSHLSVKPDVQYIVNPGGGGLDDAWVMTLRIELAY